MIGRNRIREMEQLFNLEVDCILQVIHEYLYDYRNNN